MKSASLILTSLGDGTSEALAMTEQIGKDCDLTAKSVLHLRLLAEELFGMLRGIAGKINANYWVEAEGKAIELHLKADVDITPEMKEQFLAASSSGKNEASKGFMGKLRVMIAGIMIFGKDAVPSAMINTAAASPVGSGWSMLAYKEDLKKHIKEDEDALNAWDELGKSIVANIADDVKVKIVGKTVEIVLQKRF